MDSWGQKHGKSLSKRIITCSALRLKPSASKQCQIYKNSAIASPRVGCETKWAVGCVAMGWLVAHQHTPIENFCCPLYFAIIMMTSSNGNIFRVSGPLCGNSPVTGEFLSQRPVTRSVGVFSDLLLNKRLSKQSWGWWLKTPLRPLWRHCKVLATE